MGEGHGLMAGRIVIATPHARYDALGARLAARPGLEVVRIAGRAELTPERLAEIGPDFVFFPHWSWRIPPELYERFDCVVFHMTDLPFGRGGTPLQNLILRGVGETRLSALKCVEEVDAGPIYLKRPLSLSGSAEEIFARAAGLMEEMIVTIVDERPEPAEQQGKVTAFARLGPESGNLEGVETIEAAYDRIRMLDAEGYPSAHLQSGALRFEFSNARLDGDALEAEVRIIRGSKP